MMSKQVIVSLDADSLAARLDDIEGAIRDVADGREARAVLILQSVVSQLRYYIKEAKK